MSNLVEKYRAAKAVLIEHATQLLVRFADDADFCAALAHKYGDKRATAQSFANALRNRCRHSGADVDDSPFDEDGKRAFTVSVLIWPEGPRAQCRWHNVRIPVSALESPAALKAWRDKIVSWRDRELEAAAKNLNQERRRVMRDIKSLPEHLRVVAMGKKS